MEHLILATIVWKARRKQEIYAKEELELKIYFFPCNFNIVFDFCPSLAILEKIHLYYNSHISRIILPEGIFPWKAQLPFWGVLLLKDKFGKRRGHRAAPGCGFYEVGNIQGKKSLRVWPWGHSRGASSSLPTRKGETPPKKNPQEFCPSFRN